MFLTIVPFEVVDLAAIYGTAHIFQPDNCRSVMALYRQLSAFCNRFSTLFGNYGLGEVVNTVVSDDLEIGFHTDADRLTNQIQEEIAENVLSVSLTSDLKLQFVLGNEFYQNFYIQLSQYAAETIALPQQIFHIQRQTGEENTSSLINPTIRTAAGVWVDPDNIRPNRYFVEDVVAKRFSSGESITNFDERMSIDLISTFPVSRKVVIVNGEHTEEYLLGRFDLNGFNNYSVINTYPRDGDMPQDPNTQVYEEQPVGTYNLTRAYPDYESNHFIGGALQTINFKVFCRYISQSGVVTTKLLDLADGFFVVKCLFSKKL